MAASLKNYLEYVVAAVTAADRMAAARRATTPKYSLGRVKISLSYAAHEYRGNYDISLKKIFLLNYPELTEKFNEATIITTAEFEVVCRVGSATIINTVFIRSTHSRALRFLALFDRDDIAAAVWRYRRDKGGDLGTIIDRLSHILHHAHRLFNYKIIGKRTPVDHDGNAEETIADYESLIGKWLINDDKNKATLRPLDRFPDAC